MSGLVVDSSIAICWLMPDEAASEADIAVARILRDGADAPALFLHEVANVLVVNVRRQRLAATILPEMLAEIGLWEVRLEPPALARIEDVARLAGAHGLSVYDAAYLELAMRRRCELATLDRALARAAAAAGVPLVLA